MASSRRQAVDGYNETLGTIRTAQLKHAETQDHYVSLAVFCGCGVNMIYDRTPIKDVDKLTMSQYEPCCNTPLFDAIGSSVQKLKAAIKDVEDAAVLVTVITDGYENSSREWSAQTVKKLIEECKQDGWLFAFIGAEEDILKVATTISITNTLLWDKTEEGTDAMFSISGNASKHYFDKLAMPCCVEADVADRKRMRKQFADGYFAKNEKK